MLATETLADYGAGQSVVLVDLLADAERFQYPVIFEALDKATAVPLLVGELGQQPAPDATEQDKERLARRQANVAVALVRLGAAERAWPLLAHTPDPRARTYFLHWLSLLGADPREINQRLEVEPDLTIRRALLLALGDFDDVSLPPAERLPLIAKLLADYETEPDAGLHAATEWLLRKWGQEQEVQAVVEKLRANREWQSGPKAGEKRNWYVNSQGQTMVILEAGEFLMGSPPSEPDRADTEIRHRRTIARRFAISAHEVTKAQFTAFQTERREIPRGETAEWVKTDDTPQVAMLWYEVAAYCNWLSEKEGLPEDQWCYEPNAKGKYLAGMKAKARAGELLGYRLPGEGEWEYACRAGAVTSRYYGTSEALLAKYAWTMSNEVPRAWPVGRLKPNDFGLFDMLGNVVEWTNQPFLDYPNSEQQALGPALELLDESPAVDNKNRVLRGGSFNSAARFARSANRGATYPSVRYFIDGFRVTRTYR